MVCVSDVLRRCYEHFTSTAVITFMGHATKLPKDSCLLATRFYSIPSRLLIYSPEKTKYVHEMYSYTRIYNRSRYVDMFQIDVSIIAR